MKSFSLLLLLLLAITVSPVLAQESSIKFPPFLWYESHPEEQSHFLMTFLLYWQAQNTKGSIHVFAPLYYGSETPEETLHLFLPFHFYRRVPESEISIWGPYFFQKSLQTESRILFPLYYESSDLQSQITLFLPFYYGSHSPKFQMQIGFPLYWYWKRQKGEISREIRLAIPWFQYRTPKTDFKTFFPLYWGNKTTPQDAWNLLVPLFLSTKNSEGRTKVLTPLWSQFRDEDGRTYGHRGIEFFSRDPWGGKTETIPFLFYSHWDQEINDFWLFQIHLKRYREEPRSTTSFLPLFSYRRDFNRRRLWTPLFYRDWDPESSRGFLFPYFWRNDWKKEGSDTNDPVRKRVLFPIFWNFDSPDEKLISIPPLFYDSISEEGRWTWFAPYFFRRVSGNSQFTLSLPLTFIESVTPERIWRGFLLLLWQYENESRKTTTLFPVWWMSSYPGGSSISFPGFYYLKDSQGSQGMALNTFWSNRGTSPYFLFFPLYFRLNRPPWNVKTFFPMYQFQNEEIHESGLFPIWARTNSLKHPPSPIFLSRSSRFLPFYFYRGSETISDLWLPALLSRFEREADPQKGIRHEGILFLLGGWKKSPQIFEHRFDPIYSYSHSKETLEFFAPTIPFPLWKYAYVKSGSGEYQKSGIVFPYFWWESDHDRKDLFLPLYYGHTEQNLRLRWFLNYYSKKEGETSKRFFVPFYWHTEDRWESMTTVFPLLYTSQDKSTGKSISIFPGIYREKEKDSSTWILANFFRKVGFQRKERSTVFFPLFWQFQDENRSITSVVPIYLSHRRADFLWKTLFPIFWNLETATTHIRIIPPYFSVQSKKGENKTIGLAPLWIYSKNIPEDQSSFEILGGLLGFEKNKEVHKIRLLYFVRL